jgi:hypothetical protein
LPRHSIPMFPSHVWAFGAPSSSSASVRAHSRGARIVGDGISGGNIVGTPRGLPFVLSIFTGRRPVLGLGGSADGLGWIGELGGGGGATARSPKRVNA